MATLLLASLFFQGARGFSYEGDNPSRFAVGESVDLNVNKLTSTTTLLPVEYYRLPFCPPEKDSAEVDGHNLGMLLSGDRVRSSPYRLRAGVDAHCEQLCVSDLGQEEREGARPNGMADAIRDGYHHNWIVDGLPAASRAEDDRMIVTRYWGGIPVGFVFADRLGRKRAYVHNHVNIEIQYSGDRSDPGALSIVRVVVQPFSTKHDLGRVRDDDGDPPGAAIIENPIESCDRERGEEVHTSYKMVNARGRRPQPASGRVLFTYDVIWKENKSLRWASRWDIYLSMDGAIPANIHWFSIANNLAVAVVLSTLVATILMRNLRRDAKLYKNLVTDHERAESIIQFSWKLVHADVFRPPAFFPLLLAACCGTGFQILCTAFGGILLSAVGFLCPPRRGSLLSALLILYALSGLLGGYVSARFYNIFRGKAWQEAAKYTAFGFPGIAFGLWLILDILALWQGYTYSVPLATIAILLSLWLGISTPLVYLGAYIASKRASTEFPVSTRNVARRIPAQEVVKAPVAVALAGLVNFSTCFLESYFVLSSLWSNQYYGTPGVLLLVLAILVPTCAEMAIILNYIQLSGENHRWWWRSFGTGGSLGLGFFAYSFAFLRKSRIGRLSFSTLFVYFGFMGLLSLGLFLMAGFIGISACLWFNKVMFASIATKGISPATKGIPPATKGILPVSASDPHPRDGHDGRNTMVKAMIGSFILAVLFSPALFHPSRSGVDSEDHFRRSRIRTMGHSGIISLKKLLNVDSRQTAANEEGVGNGIDLAERASQSTFTSRERVGRTVLSEKEHERHAPYLYGLSRFYLHGHVLEKAMTVSLWAIIIFISAILKRRSARPGGRIYLWNQRQVHRILTERRRRLSDILEDPILKEDMERRYGDLASLLAVVSEWRSHGFQQRKDECVKIGKYVVVPWLRNMTLFLIVVTYVSFYSGFDEVFSLMILPMAFVHLIDNMVLYRAAALKGAPGIADSQGLFAAVGIPVIEVV